MESTETFNSNPGRNSLIFVLLMLTPYFLVPPAVLGERCVVLISGSGSEHSFAAAIGLLVIAGSVTTGLGCLVAVINLFRPAVTWSRKGWMWFAIFTAIFAYRIAFPFVLPPP
jgi:hypothetical protein